MGFQWMLHWWAAFILVVKICQKTLIKEKKKKKKWSDSWDQVRKKLYILF
jgi:cytochrome b561